MGRRTVERNTLRDKCARRGGIREYRRAGCSRVEQFVTEARVHVRSDNRAVAERERLPKPYSGFGLQGMEIGWPNGKVQGTGAGFVETVLIDGQIVERK